MHALREEFPVEDAVMQLEPRVARIEGEVIQLNSRLAGVEVDLRDLRKSMDQKLDRPDVRFEQLDAKWDARLEKVVAKWDAGLEKLDAKIDRLDAKFERKLEAMSTRRFALWLTVISSAATIAAAVLAIILGTPHGH